MKYITRKEVIERIELRIKEHMQAIDKADTYSFYNPGARRAWAGHTARVAALEETLARIESGYPCNRSVAQLFAAGYRIKEDIQ